MHAQHGLKWSHFLLLAFVFVLGIFVPLSWHRKHGRHPIEPLHPRFVQVSPPTDTGDPEQIAPSHWQIDLAPTHQTNQAESLVHGFRRYCGIADPPPYFRSAAWPKPHTFFYKLQSLEQVELARQWSQDVRTQLDRLTQCQSLTDENIAIVFDALQHALDEGPSIAAQLDPSTTYCFNATCYDLKRRLAIWRAGQHLSNTFPQGLISLDQPFLCT